MYSQRDLTQEIAKCIETTRTAGSVLHPEWITTAILNQHKQIKGRDKNFYTCCTRANVRDEVRKHLNRYKAKAEATPPGQGVLEGFERLQTHYLVTRDGEQVAVPVDQMTDEEFQAKIDEQSAMMNGCAKHIEELQRYRDMRKRERKAAAAE